MEEAIIPNLITSVSRLSNERLVGCRTCVYLYSYAEWPGVWQIIGDQFVSVLRSTLDGEGSWDDETQAAWQKLFQVSAKR